MYLSKNRLLLAKKETVYGTDPTPTVADNALEVKAIKVNYQADLLDREIMRSSLSPRTPIVGKRWAEVTFTAELKGSGTKGVAPKIGALLQACGFAETASVGSSVLYSPSSSAIASVTVYVYDLDLDGGNARLHQLTGCRGQVSLKAEAGKLAELEFKMQGMYEAVTDVAAPSSPTFETTKPPVVESCNFTLNSNTDLVVQNISIDMNNEVVSQDDISTANAIKGFIITGRKPSGTFNPEAVLAATYDFLADWVAATERALSMVVGSVAGNICTISAPQVALSSLADSDKSGILTNDIPFRLSGSAAGDDELTLNFT